MKTIGQWIGDLAFQRCWPLWHACAGIRARRATRRRFAAQIAQKPHGLPAPLVVSVTSYPPRFKALEPTLQCLLTQTMRPDRVVLWLAPADQDSLPERIRALVSRGLEIRIAADTGSFKKLLPALEAFPDAFIVTVDDDFYYFPDWLERLVSAWDGSDKNVVGLQGYYAMLGLDGMLTPSATWRQYPPAATLSWFMPIGEGGVLYPPGIMHADVQDADLAQRLAPQADDLWFYWMARRNGAYHTEVPGGWRKVNWPHSQAIGLCKAADLDAKDDARLRSLVARYGWIA